MLVASSATAAARTILLGAWISEKFTIAANATTIKAIVIARWRRRRFKRSLILLVEFNI